MRRNRSGDRIRREWGRLIEVSEREIGRTIAAPAAAGANTLTVTNGGMLADVRWLSINGQITRPTGWDGDTETLSIADPLAAAADEGDRVLVWLKARDEVMVERTALVDRDDVAGVPLPCDVDQGLADALPVGPRPDGEGEDVLVEYDPDDEEWTLVRARGLARVAGPKWEDDDPHTITVDDVTAGQAVYNLKHTRLVDRSLDLYAGGEPQRADNYTVDTANGILTVPLDGWEEGVVLDPRYAYTSGPVERGLFVPWGAAGWKYLQVASSNATDRSGTGFDDSSWATGAAAFGNGGVAPYPVSTTWDDGTSLWVRRVVGPGRDFEIEVLVEDNCVIYWNGVEVGSANNADEGVVTATTFVQVPSSVANAASDNVIAIRANDEVPAHTPSSTVFLDLQVRGVVTA